MDVVEQGNWRQNGIGLSHQGEGLHVPGGYGTYHRAGIHTASGSITSQKRNREKAVTA